MKTYRYGGFLDDSKRQRQINRRKWSWRKEGDGLSLHKISKNEIVKNEGRCYLYMKKNGAKDEATSRRMQSQ